MGAVSLDSDLFSRQIWNGDSRFEVFLRGHLWIEHFMDKLLVLAFERPEAVALDRLTWVHKLHLCDGLGLLRPWEPSPFAEVNRIRNKLVHNLAGEPSDEDIAKLLRLSPANVLAAVDAVRKVEEKGDRLREDADSPLADLRFWLFALAMDMDHRIETTEYDKEHRVEIWRAVGRVVARENTDNPISQEDAEKAEGLPPRPQPGDSFRSSPAG
jgi:hypothetical protein